MISKWLGVRGSSSEASSLHLVIGRLFTMFSDSQKTSLSRELGCSIAYKTRLIVRIILYQSPPWWEARGGLKTHSTLWWRLQQLSTVVSLPLLSLAGHLHGRFALIRRLSQSCRWRGRRWRCSQQRRCCPFHCRRQKDQLPSGLYCLYCSEIHCLSRTPMIGLYRGVGISVVKLQAKQTMQQQNTKQCSLAKQTPKISTQSRKYHIIYNKCTRVETSFRACYKLWISIIFIHNYPSTLSWVGFINLDEQTPTK